MSTEEPTRHETTEQKWIRRRWFWLGTVLIIFGMVWDFAASYMKFLHDSVAAENGLITDGATFKVKLQGAYYWGTSGLLLVILSGDSIITALLFRVLDIIKKFAQRGGETVAHYCEACKRKIKKIGETK